MHFFPCCNICEGLGHTANIRRFKRDHPALRRFLMYTWFSPTSREILTVGAVYQKEKDALKEHLVKKPVAVILV